MKQTLTLFLCCTFCLLLANTSLRATQPEDQQQFADKANLALRQVGHQLLQVAGDTHSTLSPVVVSGLHEFTLKLERPLNYDTLPQLLHQALQAYGIQRDYWVAIKTCEADDPILGYNQVAFAKGEVPCLGRERSSSCNHITLTFAPLDKSPAEEKNKLPFAFLSLGALALIGVTVFWKQTKEKMQSDNTQGEHILPLGNYDFDFHNQQLILDNHKTSLTFRESKLLHYMAKNANQVLTRDRLIDEVWGDEGVIVGRSLDVFISRLRKILKADGSVQIKTVHGVGYRLQIIK